MSVTIFAEGPGVLAADVAEEDGHVGIVILKYFINR